MTSWWVRAAWVSAPCATPLGLEIHLVNLTSQEIQGHVAQAQRAPTIAMRPV